MKPADNMKILPKGSVLFHGTDAEFDEAEEGLDGPAWFSTSHSVAGYFARRSGRGGIKRVIAFSLEEDLALHEIYSAREMQAFADEHNLCLLGVEDMRESIEASGIPGWRIPSNYPDGDDIVIASTHLDSLTYLKTYLV